MCSQGDKVTPEDIDNEVKAVSTLCSPEQCKYVVEVLKHGWLPRQQGAYFIDMECCEESLNRRLQRAVATRFILVRTESSVSGLSESDLMVLKYF